MPIYQGSCHCGAVRFEVETVLDKATSCNCSICTRKGALHHRVAPENFRLRSGQADLTLYQAGDKTAKHWFCKHCGMHPFSNPRAAPDMVSINLHCLDNFWEIAGQIEVREFDGQHWEEAVKAFRF
jgi:hypothetical protein